MSVDELVRKDKAEFVHDFSAAPQIAEVEQFEIRNDFPPSKEDYLQALKEGEAERARELYAEMNSNYH